MKTGESVTAVSADEVRVYRLYTIRTCILIVCTAATLVTLFWLSRSWHSLWALLMLLARGNLRTGKAAEK